MSGYDDFPRALEKVTELISKLMLVESVVHAQQNGNRQLVEGLVHRQNLTRLQDYLKPLHSADIASLLEALPIEERQLVWLSIDNQKAADILMYLAEPVRDNLIQVLKAIGRAPAMGASILITATTDSLGFFIFLGLATLLLD